MDQPDAAGPLNRLLVVLPNWVGDVVMASPVLAALRSQFRDAKIAFLMRPYVREIVAGCDWHDDEMHWPSARGIRAVSATRRLVYDIRDRNFDAALLLTNSLRSALVAWAARVPRRIGYARDGRSLFLTDRLRPLKRGGEFLPTPLLPYYIALAGRLGCTVTDRRLRLGVSPEQERTGRDLLRHYELLTSTPEERSAIAGGRDARPTLNVCYTAVDYAVINPGAAFGAAKCWLPERFADVCDRLSHERGLRCVLVGAPGELPLLREIAQRAATAPILFDNPTTTLGTLKVIVREAKLLVCNDTGPRHYGNAFGVPTVTIFGPTHQEWTATDNPLETALQASVACGPCQLPTCPLDHRCMKAITPEMVMSALPRRAGASPAPGG